MNSIIVPKGILESIKEKGADLIVTVINEAQGTTVTWKIDGELLAGSKDKLKDLNLAIDIQEKGNKLELNVRGEEGLAANTSVTFYAAGMAGIKANKKVYIYGKDLETGKLYQLPSTDYTVGKDGYVNLTLYGADNYVVTSKKAVSSEVTSIINQVKVESKNQLKLNESSNVNVKLPAGIANKAKITYTSSNQNTAVVSNTGTIKAKKVGTAVITVKVIIGSETKSYKINIKVK